MFSLKRELRNFGKLLGFNPVRLPELDERLAAMETVFQAPPFTQELVDAIRLISPHCDFKPDDKYRAVWEADQNGACWGEYEGLEPLLSAMDKPRKILEIGPGMGRSLIFFSKKQDWSDAEIHAYEGEGTTTKYTLMGPRFEDSFCGNIAMLKHVLNHNGINNVSVFNVKQTKMPDLPGPYDLLYSFYSVGYHWAIEHFWADLMPLFGDKTIGLFTVPPEFEPFDQLDTVHYRILDWVPAWPVDAKLKFLVISKSELPDF